MTLNYAAAQINRVWGKILKKADKLEKKAKRAEERGQIAKARQLREQLASAKTPE